MNGTHYTDELNNDHIEDTWLTILTHSDRWNHYQTVLAENEGFPPAIFNAHTAPPQACALLISAMEV